MRELRRSNDVVFLSFAEAVLRDAGMRPVVLDAAMSVMDGSIGALPRRLMVDDADYAQAMVLIEALERERAGDD